VILFQCELPVVPVAWQRVTPFRGGRLITAQETRVFQTTIKQLAKIKMGAQPPYDQPLRVLIDFWVERKKGERIYCDVRPDVDNFGKSVLDALNGVVWSDDCRIIELTLSKRWTRVGAGRIFLEVKDAKE
jgi:Holliday junction resolvase RusA-like endonuclease